MPPGGMLYCRVCQKQSSCRTMKRGHQDDEVSLLLTPAQKHRKHAEDAQLYQDEQFSIKNLQLARQNQVLQVVLQACNNVRNCSQRSLMP